MQIEINEEELQEWAINRIKKRIGDRVNTLMSEWDWRSYMQQSVDKITREKLSGMEVNIETSSLKKNETVIIDGITGCCGYDFGDEAFGERCNIKFCPECGKRITKVN